MQYDSVEKIATIYGAAMDKEALRPKPSKAKMDSMRDFLASGITKKAPPVADLTKGFGRLVGQAAGSRRGARV